MESEPVHVFSHRAEYPTSNGNDVLEIEITFNGTYTIKTTHSGPYVCGPRPQDITYIRNIPYLPRSVMDMLSITGGNSRYVADNIIGNLYQVCADTLPKEKKEIETNFESETIRQLRAELAFTRESVVELQKKFDEIQDKNTELLDTLVDQLQKIGELEDTNQELLQLTKSIEEQSLDTMLESAFEELDM
jgi:hypothetical protein